MPLNPKKSVKSGLKGGLKSGLRKKLSASCLAPAAATAVLLSPAVLAAPELVEDYCVKCHNFEDWAGGLDLEGLNFDHVEGAAATWEMVVRKLSTGMMPPNGETRPPRAEINAFTGTLEARLDAAVESIPAPPALHRLNRTEYANVIRDLLRLEVDTSLLLPSDDASEGFDTIADTLTNSPALIQGYVSAAMKISRWAVGDMTTTESTATYNAPAGLVQDKHLDGMPLGTRGGMKVTHNFPLDAEYEFSVRGPFGFGPAGTGRRNTRMMTHITLDGRHVEMDNPRSFRLPVSAGSHEITAAVVDLLRPTGVNDIYSVYGAGGGIDSIEITGPFNATGPGDTASRRRIFVCYPASNDQETACASEIISTVARRAFRQPVTEHDIEPMMAFYHQGYREGNFETGIQQALSRVLIDPRFLFRVEREPENTTPGDVYAISDLELATRLSFFLWSSIPDDELLELAARGELSRPDVLEGQVRRMLQDSKAQALVDNFAGQWLYLRQVADVTPEADSFDENLRQAFIQETRLLVDNIISQHRPVTELLNADYTFLNERLARHYGIEGVWGSQFRKVDLPPDSPRRGLLGHGSILTVTSTASRTSPVVRGSWILENLLHAPVPEPPPNVDTNLEGDGTVVLTSSIRERLEAHREDPVCASCHGVIDPVGFALENFDSVGAWREYDGDSAVDATGTLVDGTEIHGPGDLRAALLSRSRVFAGTVTEKLMTYALGRALEYHDMPAVRAILRAAQASDYRFSDLVMGVVESDLFQKRVKN